MSHKYEKLMEQWEIANLDNPVLNPSFVSKAKDFQDKLSKNELTEQEAATIDEELVELFNSKHDFIEEESEEVRKANRGKAISDARAAIAEEDNLDNLKKMIETYKDLPEVSAALNTKIAKVQKIVEKEQQDKEEKERKEAHNAKIASGKSEIQGAKYEDLAGLQEKYKDIPELLNLIKEKLEKEKPGKEEEALRAQLLSKREWNYAMLRALGVKPTGNDMVVAGVTLEKEFLLDVYRVKK